MKSDDKIKIVNALIEIKLALSEYNNVLNNGQGYTDEDYEQLKKAFDGTKLIARILR